MLAHSSLILYYVLFETVNLPLLIDTKSSELF